jgi:GR25 family glycosyltransferase involved in LPS biosynthesis
MKVNEFFDKVVVINLDRRTDRMEKLDLQLKELDIQYKRFSAVDAIKLNIDPIVAGLRSHLQVIKDNIGRRVLVLEDDAYFVDNFNEKFEKVMQTLPEDWDIFYLGALVPKDVGQINMVNRHWGIQVLTTGTQAYCIRPEMQHYFISKLEDYNYYIDIGLRDFAKGYKPYITQPNLVTQFPSYSDLRLKEVNDF